MHHSCRLLSLLHLWVALSNVGVVDLTKLSRHLRISLSRGQSDRVIASNAYLDTLSGAGGEVRDVLVRASGCLGLESQSDLVGSIATCRYDDLGWSEAHFVVSANLANRFFL